MSASTDSFDVVVAGTFVGHVRQERGAWRFTRFREPVADKFDDRRTFAAPKQAVARMVYDEIRHCNEELRLAKLAIAERQSRITRTNTRRDELLAWCDGVRKGRVDYRTPLAELPS